MPRAGRRAEIHGPRRDGVQHAHARARVPRQRDGVGAIESYQHFAVVLDDLILASPYIDFRESPDASTRASWEVWRRRRHAASRRFSARGRCPTVLTDLDGGGSE